MTDLHPLSAFLYQKLNQMAIFQSLPHGKKVNAGILDRKVLTRLSFFYTRYILLYKLKKFTINKLYQTS